MSKIHKTRTVTRTHEIIRIHSGEIKITGRCPLCGHDVEPPAEKPLKLLEPTTGASGEAEQPVEKMKAISS